MIQDGNMVIIWSVDDVLSIGEDEYGNQRLSYEEAYEILERMDDNYDAERGMNWNVIEMHVSVYLSERDETV